VPGGQLVKKFEAQVADTLEVKTEMATLTNLHCLGKTLLGNGARSGRARG
jgi:hypothetical protein